MTALPADDDDRWLWLASTDELQEQSFGGVPHHVENGYNEAFADYVLWNHTAAVAELSEALNEVGWKPWAVKRGWVNREAFVGELVDVLHFIGNMLVAVGCTDDELEAVYRLKQETNRRRMATGTYDGRNKCPACGRAFDDPATRCRPGLHLADHHPAPEELS